MYVGIFSLVLGDGPQEAAAGVSHDPVGTGLDDDAILIAVVHVLDTDQSDHVEAVRAWTAHAELAGLSQPDRHDREVPAPTRQLPDR